jgi:hypothetical protein
MIPPRLLRFGLSVLTLLVAGALAAPSAHGQLTDLRTAAERSGFTEYTPFDDMMSYLAAVQAGSTEVRSGVYGQTFQGRDLPYLVFSRPAVSQPWEAWSLGRPVVALNANVHGGERTLRESLLVLVRELATPGTDVNALLDELVVVVAPQINPDGFEASPRGTRGNAWGIDLNRDWVKREQPALTAYGMNIINAWAPHLFVDGHNGGSFPYHLTYQCPSHAEPDQRITALCDEEIFPAVAERLEGGGYEGWYYTRGTETRWDGGGYDARIGRNYGGFINAAGILFESPPWMEMETGVDAGVLGFKAVLEYAAANGTRLVETVERARRETVAMGQAPSGDVVIEMEYAPQPRTVTYKIGVEEGDSVRVLTVTSDSLMTRPVPTRTRPRPYAYFLPRDAVDAVAMLRRNGITVEVLRDEVELTTDAYVVEDVRYERAYNHDAAVRLVLADEPVTEARTYPAGTYVVRTGQMLGRLAAHMLEPETNDNVIYWNTMDAWLPLARLQQLAGGEGDAVAGGQQGFAGGFGSRDQGPPLAPITKLMEARGLPLRILD